MKPDGDRLKWPIDLAIRHAKSFVFFFFPSVGKMWRPGIDRVHRYVIIYFCSTTLFIDHLHFQFPVWLPAVYIFVCFFRANDMNLKNTDVF